MATASAERSRARRAQKKRLEQGVTYIDFDGTERYYSTGKKWRAKTSAKPKQPLTLDEVIAKIGRSRELNPGIKQIKKRADEFDSEQQMLLAGIAMREPARQAFDKELDRIWKETERPELGLRSEVQEVIIGGGFHAAVYASVRAAMGHPKPLVIEKGKRVGGAFAISEGPSFYLNSRNRPGTLGLPGRGEALNVLPAGPIQPADLSGDEYQRNSDLAFAIRCALAQNAIVVTNTTVERVSGTRIYLREGRGRQQALPAPRRIIHATGLGVEKRPIEHDRVLTSGDLMKRMDEPFPLKGLKRVAVVGVGDSGRTAIEALTGQAPSTGMSVPSLDWVEEIDWYGMVNGQSYRTEWEGCNRSRYKPIARNLPRGPSDRQSRVRPVFERCDQVSGGFDGVVVNGRRYDHVIWCAGYERADSDEAWSEYPAYYVDGRSLARRVNFSYPERFVVGPAAGLDMDGYEVNALPANVSENAVALFRYADRTATLAADLKGF